MSKQVDGKSIRLPYMVRSPVGVRIRDTRAINTKNAKSRFFLKTTLTLNTQLWHQPPVAQAALPLPLVLLKAAKLILLKRAGFIQPTIKITCLNHFVKLHTMRRLPRV
jgi:hypothetical protein